MREHNESQLQKSCVMWFRLQYPRLRYLLFAVPNGGARSAVTGAILYLLWSVETVVWILVWALLLEPR